MIVKMCVLPPKVVVAPLSEKRTMRGLTACSVLSFQQSFIVQLILTQKLRLLSQQSGSLSSV